MAPKSRRMPLGLQAKKIRIDIVNAGLDPQLYDLHGFLDPTLTFQENRHNIARLFGYRVGDTLAGTTAHRGGQIPRNLLSIMGQTDDYNAAEKRRIANQRQKTKGKTSRKTVSKNEFKHMRQLSLWQSDDYPFHPTEELDKARGALPPGRRLSRNGRIYYERRRNRSDMPGTGI